MQILNEKLNVALLHVEYFKVVYFILLLTCAFERMTFIYKGWSSTCVKHSLKSNCEKFLSRFGTFYMENKLTRDQR